MRNLFLLISVKAWLFTNALRRQVNTAISVALASALAPVAANADDDIFGMFDHVADGADNSSTDWTKLAKFSGIGCCFIGLILMIAKKKNPQIGWGLICTFWGVGFCLIALDQFIKKGQATIDINPTDIG